MTVQRIAVQPGINALQIAADNAKPGDVITIQPGNYAGFQLTSSGTPTQPIRFDALPGVIINAPAPVGNGDGINLEGASHITIQGFTVTGAARAGIRSVTNKDVRIRNNDCYLNGMWGIFTAYSDYVDIEENICSYSIGEHGIYVSHATQSPRVRYNRVFGNNINGIHLNSGTDGFVTNAIISYNEIYDNGKGGGSGINCDGLIDSIIEWNIIYGNRFLGISLYRDTSPLPSTGNRLQNNIVVMIGADGKIVENSIYALNIRKGSTNNECIDNIFGSMLLDADCVPGYRGIGNTVCVPVGARMFLSTDSDATRFDIAGWLKSTGEVLTVGTPEQLFKCWKGFYTRK